MRAALLSADASGQGFLTSEQLEQGLAAAGLKFTRHQVISLRRKLDKERAGSAAAADVLAALGL